MAAGRKPKAIEGDPQRLAAYNAILAFDAEDDVRTARKKAKAAVAAVMDLSGLPRSELAAAVEDYA